LVVLLLDGVPVFGIVVEVQLSQDERKQYVWPAYVAGLRARLRCPVSLLVITVDDACARWAARTIYMGGGSCLVPWVLGPSGVPEITDREVARSDPELAVLSVMAHGKDADADKSVRIALAAQLASVSLDEGRAKLYRDLIFHSLSEAARRAFRTMMNISKQDDYESDFVKEFIDIGLKKGHMRGLAQGIAEGLAQGRAELVLRLLTIRFGELDEDVKARINAGSPEQLDAIGERLLTARTLQEALG